MPVSYQEYLRSRRWLSSPARLREIILAGRRCRVCNQRHGLEVHHRTYARVGRERVSDLTTLCRDCHELVTSELRWRRYQNRSLPAVTSVPPPKPRCLIDSTEGWQHVR
jgi:5-methylcytosine-specific restriction endonuclease McrA